MDVIVVTNTELGWDCVAGVYTDEKVAREEHIGDEYVFTTKKLNNTTHKKLELSIDLKDYQTVESRSHDGYDNHVLLVDSCNIFKDKNNLGNNKVAMLEIIKLHLEFTNNKFEYYLVIDDDEDCFIYLNTKYDDWKDDSIEFEEFLESRGYEIR